MWRRNQGFALPTIVITAVILMMVLIAALSSVASVRRSLNDQYYNQMAKEAAEAGFEFAQGCLRKNNGTVTWSAAQPLHPNTSCTGGAACTGNSSCYVMSTSTARTSFTVSDTVLQSGNSYLMNISAKTELLQESISAVRETYSYSEQQLVELTAKPVSSGLVLNLDAANAASYTSGNTVWNDLSGNGNNGTLTGTVGYSTSGGGALSFGGSGYVSIPNSSSLQLTGSMTFSFWIYPTNLAAGRQNILDKAYGGEYATTLEPTGYMTSYYGTSGALTTPYSGWNVSPVTQNKWQEITVVRDLSTMAISSYVNGNQVGYGTAAYASATASTLPVTLGRGYTGVYYNGLIANVRIYNRALSYPEVRQNFVSLRDRYYASSQPSCLSILKAGLSTGSGVYTINPSGIPLSVYCDMTNDGGGWTLVLQNNSTVTTPSPTWADSILTNNITGTLSANLAGFDQQVGLNYWSNIGTQLRAQVGSTPTAISHKALYTFYMNPQNYYAINLSNENVTLGGASPGLYTYHNGMPWTTYDSDHDLNGGNCASYYGNHPWWYGGCWTGNFFAGGSGYQEAPYWTGTSGDYYAYGSLWVR
jgi:Tfp pilus assembly protein PilX